MKDARINGGLVGSGAAFITHTLYRMMFNEPDARDERDLLSNEDALVKLIARQVDRRRRGGGRAAGADDRQHEAGGAEVHQAAEIRSRRTLRASRPLTIYAPSTVRASSYPNLLKERLHDHLGRRVPRHLRLQPADHRRLLIRFSRSLCQNFSTLQAKGHPKWREVELALPRLNKGWTYYPPTARELRNCIAGKAQAAKPKTCAPEERILGFCT